MLQRYMQHLPRRVARCQQAVFLKPLTRSQQASTAAALADQHETQHPDEQRQLQLGTFGRFHAAAAATDSKQATTFIGPRPGYTWVNRQGRALLQGPQATLLPPPPPPKPLPPAVAERAALSPGARSLRLWGRVSQGMLPGTSATPQSTAAAAYAYPSKDLLEPVEATHHLRKTEFSE
jgi:hypothetical protein